MPVALNTVYILSVNICNSNKLGSTSLVMVQICVCDSQLVSVNKKILPLFILMSFDYDIIT